MSDNEFLPPNLFIIGAPKCGTTALSHYLAQHPQVFMTESAGVKEPFYFSIDVCSDYLPTVLETSDYRALFRSASPSCKYLGEASTAYLFSKVAVPHILETCRVPRFIVMLRSPLDLARSSHNEFVKRQGEIFDFERAWCLQEARRAGKSLPKAFSDGTVLQYGSIAKLGEQLERLYTRVDRNNVHVIVYDDFKRDTRACYEKLLAWLDLPADPTVSFERINHGRNYRAVWLEMLLRRVRSVRRTLHVPGGLGVNALIDRFNVTHQYRPLRPEFEQELKDYFREDVRLLSDLLGRDLTRWTD